MWERILQGDLINKLRVYYRAKKLILCHRNQSVFQKTKKNKLLLIVSSIDFCQFQKVARIDPSRPHVVRYRPGRN